MSNITSTQPITFVAAIRDMIQSLYGGGMPHDTYEVLNFYKLIKDFNAAGAVQIVGVEGHGGALPQYDAINKRWPLKIAERITAALDRTIFQRPLIRGPFGVRLDALHYDDLEWTLQQMAISGGAQKGHRVIFKLFEAQNRPEEYVASLKIIDDMRKAGYNVACEVAMVISDKPDLDADHYRRVAQSLLSPSLFRKNKIDPAVVAGFTLKDMIGGVKASTRTSSSINARNLALIAMETATAFGDAMSRGRKQISMYVGSHTHDIGNAVDFITEAGQTFSAHKAKHPRITEFQADVAADNFGFADLPKLVERLLGVGAMAEGMSAAQTKIWGQMKGFLDAAAERYAAFRIDTKKWPASLLEYGQLASGGLPYVEANGIKPYLNYVAKLAGPDGQPVGTEKAGEILRCVFASINGVLASDLGNAHSVTPAMKLLNDLTINVMGTFLQSAEFKTIVGVGGNFSQPFNDEQNKGWFRQHYASFSNAAAMAYFCTPMPTPVNDGLLGMLRGKLFEHFFPKDYKLLQKVDASNTASMLKHLDEAKYAEVREALSQNLLNKDGARAILMADGVRPEGAEAEAAYIEKVDFFVAAHIDVNRLPINHGVKPIRVRKIEPAVQNFAEGHGGLRAARSGLGREDDVVRHGTFTGLLVRPRGAALAEVVRTLLTGTFAKHRGWPPAAMKENGNGNGHASNGNGAEVPTRPGIKGKSEAVAGTTTALGQPAVSG